VDRPAVVAQHRGESRLDPEGERRLVEGEKWANAVELGGYGPIIDQDMPNLARLQKGLRATKKPGVTLANYQEVRIRHFHQTLKEYIDDKAGG